MRSILRKMTAMFITLCLAACITGIPVSAYGIKSDEEIISAAGKGSLDISIAGDISIKAAVGNLMLSEAGTTGSSVEWSPGTPKDADGGKAGEEGEDWILMMNGMDSEIIWIGEGTEEDPYEVSSAEHFEAIPEMGLDAHYIQTAENIDLSASSNWKPIGDGTAPFTGTYNGGGWTISNLAINDGTLEHVGLFGLLGEGGRLEDINLKNVSIISTKDAQWQEVGRDWKYNGIAHVGGLAGTIDRGIVTGCSSVGSVTAGTAARVGGLAGVNAYDYTAGTITDCSSEGTVTGGDDAMAGGLVGYNMGTASGFGVIDRSWSGATVTGGNSVNGTFDSQSCAGGLVGKNDGTLRGNHSTGNVSGGIDANIGGMVGIHSGNSVTEFKDSSSTGKLTGGAGAMVGALIGKIFGGDITLNSIDITTPAAKLSYKTGEALDIEGLVVTGQYSNNNTAVLPINRYHIDGFDSSEPVQGQVLTIDFDGKTTTYSIDIEPFVWPGTGSGTAADPYKVATAEQLDAVRYYVNDDTVYFEQTDNIDLSGFDNWLPIGDEFTGLFDGTYDGKGYIISNLKIYRNSISEIGLFCGLMYNAEIKNIYLMDVDVENYLTGDYAFAGSLVGYNNYGTVRNCGVVSGSIRSAGRAGGLLGYNDGTVIDSFSMAAVCGGDDEYTGGLIGYSGGDVANCYSTGDVTGGNDASVGGLIGYSAGNVNCCYSTGTVSGGARSAVGGLVGLNTDSLENSYSTGNAEAEGDQSSVGGLVGANGVNISPHDQYPGAITNCYSIGTPTGTSGAISGGLVGAQNFGSITNSYYDRETAGQADTNGTPKSTAEMRHQAIYEGWNFGGVWLVEEGQDYPVLDWQISFAGGDGSTEAPYEVATAMQLNKLRSYLNNGDVFFIQTADIDLSGYANWAPIGYDYNNAFTGTFDGGGKTISNLTINDDTLEAVGLFGYVRGNSIIKNVRLENVEVISSNENGWAYVGGLAGNFATWEGIIEYCSVQGRIMGANSAQIGGLAGMSNGSIRRCFTSGTVEGTDNVYCIGGIVGFLYGSAESCYSTADVRVGDSTAEGDIDTYIGGLIGTCGEIINCYSTGSVAAGSVMGTENGISAGGLVGGNADLIAGSYSTGSVTGGTGSILGGLVGVNSSGIITDCYYLDTAADSSAGGTAGTATAMKHADTYENWDFTEDWRIVEDVTYPILIWQSLTADECIIEDWEALNWDAVKGENSTESSVITGLFLLTAGANGTAISWSSNDPDVIAVNGTVTRPSYSHGNKTVTLTAVISKDGGTERTKDFILTVKAKASSGGSNTGGNGGGMPTPPPEPDSTIDSNGNIVTAPELDPDKGVAAANTDISIINTAFEKAVQNADGKRRIEISVPEVDGATGYECNLPASILTSEPDKQLVIKTNVAAVTLPGSMLSQVAAAGAENVSLSIAPADIAVIDNDEIRSLIGGRTVIQLNLSVDGNPLAWRNEDAPVQVSIPYAPTEAELADPEFIVVWYIDGNGEVVSVPNGKYDPETGNVTFSTTHFSRFAIAYVHKTFSDLDSVGWARKPIEAMASRGIITGTGNNTFSPAANITKADYLVLLVKTLGLTTEFDSNFDDIKPGRYYYEAVGIAKKLGIVYDSGDNLFNPRESISRQDMMVMTARALEISKGLKTEGDPALLDEFDDKGDIDDAALRSIAVLVRKGLIAGSGNKLRPRADATRAETAVFLFRCQARHLDTY